MGDWFRMRNMASSCGDREQVLINMLIILQHSTIKFFQSSLIFPFENCIRLYHSVVQHLGGGGGGGGGGLSLNLPSYPNLCGDVIISQCLLPACVE